MRKLFILTIAMVYLGISSGIALNIHYCMNRIANVSLHMGEQDEDACGTCGMDKENNHCCKDVIKVVKLSDNHQPSKLVFQALNLSAALPVAETDLTSNVQGISIAPLLVYLPPPPRELNYVYLVNSVFRI